jgi:hypothetical protein
MNLKHNWGNIIVDCSIALNGLAALGYALQYDWKKAFYWAAAMIIGISVRIM